MEDRAEEERAAQEAAKETDTQVEDDEMAAKRRIAEEELAKLNGPKVRFCREAVAHNGFSAPRRREGGKNVGARRKKMSCKLSDVYFHIKSSELSRLDSQLRRIAS